MATEGSRPQCASIHEWRIFTCLQVFSFLLFSLQQDALSKTQEEVSTLNVRKFYSMAVPVFHWNLPRYSLVPTSLPIVALSTTSINVI